MAQGVGTAGHCSPRPHAPPPPRSPTAAGLAGDRWLPPSAAAPQRGSPPRYRPRSSPYATGQRVAGRGSPHGWSAPRLPPGELHAYPSLGLWSVRLRPPEAEMRPGPGRVYRTHGPPRRRPLADERGGRARRRGGIAPVGAAGCRARGRRDEGVLPRDRHRGSHHRRMRTTASRADQGHCPRGRLMRGRQMVAKRSTAAASGVGVVARWVLYWRLWAGGRVQCPPPKRARWSRHLHLAPALPPARLNALACWALQPRGVAAAPSSPRSRR
jgi:hypothetical protein